MSAEFSQLPSFPKNMSYNLKRLNGTLIKQRLKLNADLTTYNPNSTIGFNLPIGRMIDLRSLVIYAKGTTSGTGGLHFPRGGLHSLIEQFSVNANNRTLQNTPYYNYVWNTIADLEGYSSIEQQTKRITEIADPSARYTYTNGTNSEGVIAGVNVTGNTTNDTNISMCANNFLGFFNSSVSTIDTNNLGQIQIKLQLAPSGVLFAGGSASAVNITDASYTLSDVYLTVDTITFTNSLYYDLVKSQLDTDGLNIGYYDYYTIQGSTFAKSSGLNFSTQINASSLDQVIATFRRSDYSTIKPLLLYNSGASSTATLNKYLADPITNINNSITANNSNLGDGFNQSAYFQRAGAGILTSSWYINSQPFTNQSPPIEIFNNTLQTFGYNNLDIASGGIHGGCQSLEHYKKYYFVDALSLENISGDGNWWVSGLNGNGGTILISYNATFDSTNGAYVYPYIICRTSKLLNVKMGRALDLIE
jgi:hypothetical protein